MDDKAKIDKSDDQEVACKFEAEGDSIPFSEMHEIIEDSNSLSYGTCTENNKKNEEGIFYQRVYESEIERKGEGKQEQLSPIEQYEKSEKLRRDTEAVNCKCFPCKQAQEYKKVGSEIYEVMQVECPNELLNDRVRREAWVNLQSAVQNEHDNNIKKKEMLKALQDVSLNEQETEKAKRKMLKALQDVSQNGQENNMRRKEIEEVLQNLSKTEQDNTRIKREVLEALQNVFRIEQENKWVRRKAEEALLVVLIDKIIGDSNTSTAAGCSKPHIQVVEGESLAKAEESKSKVLHGEFKEDFSQFLKVDGVMCDKVTTEDAENDELEKEKDLKVKFTSQDLELSRNEKFDNPSSDEENKEMDKFSKKENS